MVVKRAAKKRDRVGRWRGGRPEGEVAGLDRHVGAGTHRAARSAWARAGSTAVADHRRPCPPPASARPRPSGREELLRPLDRCRSLSAEAWRSPVTITRLDAELVERSDRARDVGFSESPTTRAPCAVLSHPAKTTARRGCRPARPPRAPSACTDSNESGRPTRTSVPSTVARTPTPGCSNRLGTTSSTPRARAPSATARAIGCSDGSSAKPAARKSCTSLAPDAGATTTSCIRPCVIVPVLSSTATSTARVASRTSPPLITMPSCAPRPVPTMIAVGVARPRAHGHAMISTATAAVNASSAGWPVSSQIRGSDARDPAADRPPRRRRVDGRGRGADHRVPVRPRPRHPDRDHGGYRAGRGARHRDQGRRRSRGDACGRRRGARQDRHDHAGSDAARRGGSRVGRERGASSARRRLRRRPVGASDRVCGCRRGSGARRRARRPEPVRERARCRGAGDGRRYGGAGGAAGLVRVGPAGAARGGRGGRRRGTHGGLRGWDGAGAAPWSSWTRRSRRRVPGDRSAPPARHRDGHGDGRPPSLRGRVPRPVSASIEWSQKLFPARRSRSCARCRRRAGASR